MKEKGALVNIFVFDCATGLSEKEEIIIYDSLLDAYNDVNELKARRNPENA